MDELDQFRITLQQLEVCRELLLTGGETGCRVSLILLDNVSETILYRIVQDEFEKDDFTRAFVPERYPPKVRRQIDRLFSAKLEAVARARSLPPTAVTTLLILHDYRNAAYHRDTHNPVVLPLLARVALIAAADLFSRTRGGIRISAAGGGGEPIAWLQRYGFVETFVDFDAAARSVARQLKAKVRPTLPALIQGFVSDIILRISTVREVLTQRLPAPNEDEINRVLKWFEFRHRNPDLESKLSTDWRELNYRVASGHASDITREQYVEAESKFRASYTAAHEQYQPACTFAGLAQIEADISKLQMVKSYRGALQEYSERDAQIRTFEEVSSAAYRQFGCQSEMESDIRRGK